MVVPLILLFVSAALGGFAFLRQGPALSDLVLLAAIMGLAALILLLKAALWRPVARGEAGPKPAPKPDRKPAGRGERWIVVDGSNVMHWRGNTPDLEVLRAAVAALRSGGYVPLIWFDANVGYKLEGEFLNARDMAMRLGVKPSHVRVAKKGEVADTLLLAEASSLGVKVVTNDQYRDWQDQYPWVSDAGRVMRGGVRDGAIWVG